MCPPRPRQQIEYMYIKLEYKKNNIKQYNRDDNNNNLVQNTTLKLTLT